MLTRNLLAGASIRPSASGFHSSTVCRWQKFENERHYEPGEDIFARIWHGFTYDFRRWRRRFYEARRDAWQRKHPVAHMKTAVLDNEVWPYRAEICIIGGGLTGSATAYWIKQRFRDEDFKVVVIENNSNMWQGTTMLSTGGISAQFSMDEHIDMSLFSAEFMRHAGEHLRILDNAEPDVNFLPKGFLHLATTEEQKQLLSENWKKQVEKGVRVSLLTREELSARFPFMDFSDVIIGSLGIENEGTIDTWQLLAAMREKNISLGVQYVKGEVEGFEFNRPPEQNILVENDFTRWRKDFPEKMLGLTVRPQMSAATARPIRAHLIVNAAGPWAGKIAQLAGIGKGEGILAVPVPIEPRKRQVFVVFAPDVPAEMPVLFDQNNIRCTQMNIGNTYLISRVPTAEEDKQIDHSDLSVDYSEFSEKIFPVLVKRCPAFASAVIKSAYAGYEDHNTFDSCPIIGPHPTYTTFHMMCGFGSRSAMHSIAAAYGYMEKILDGAYININLRKFDMRRIVKFEPLNEAFRI